MNPMQFLFSAAAALADFGRSMITMDGPRGPRHFGHTYEMSNDLYGRAQDGSIRLRQPKAPSRADRRRARGQVQRLCQLCKLGRITRADRDARASAIGFTRRPAQATA